MIVYNVFKQNWKNSINQSEQTREDKLLLSMIFGLIKQHTIKMNQFEKVLYQTFPEMLASVLRVWYAKHSRASGVEKYTVKIQADKKQK